MQIITLILALLFAPTLLAQGLTVREIESIRSMPNPSAHNPNLGILEVGNGGTTTFYSTAGDKQVYVGAGRVVSVQAQAGTSPIRPWPSTTTQTARAAAARSPASSVLPPTRSP